MTTVRPTPEEQTVAGKHVSATGTSERDTALPLTSAQQSAGGRGRLRPALAVRNLRVSLGSGRRQMEVVHGVDVRVSPGESLAVIGPNGSGKSTMLRAIAGLVPSSGSVQAASGRRPTPTDLALMPQSPVLPPGMTVAEYVLVGRTPHLGWLGRESAADLRIVADVLARLDLEAYAKRPVSNLSGGEGQRVALARALAQQVPLLLLDEPTSSLDVGAQTDVLDLVESLRRTDGLTVVLAIHDLGTAARYADRLLLLREGRTVAFGTPEAVLRDDVLSDVYGTPLQVREIDGDLVVLPRRSGRGTPPAPPVGDIR